ncbi:stage V sporulation protein D [Bacillus testis]|uniref:stage V sporulation protein D n=1 Tax=Bacillus testis TaxID=1622072 RepID=UPI00067EC36E|nr:stage V sporulation protein D [Bacillus testis]
MRVSNVTVRKRLLIFFLIGICVFILIDLRLGYVQFYLGNLLTGKAKDSWSRDIPFEPKRGEIVDRNGVALATNLSAPTVYVVPRQVTDPKVTAEKLAAALNMKQSDAYKEITQNSSNVRLSKGRKISHQKAKEIKALNLKGVYIAEDSIRYYPFGKYLSHVLGFTGIDNQGLMGVELTYDNELKGKKGHVQFYADAKGKRLENMADDFKAPVNGKNLQLTIDNRIQTIMEREMDIAQATYNPDGMIGIAMNPNTGEILGMGSRPTFNPSEYQSVSSEVYNRNLPVWSTYEPGSTFKIITLAAALQENKVNLNNDTFFDSGSVKVAGANLHCWKRGGHGSQTFLEVVQNSCNPGFVELGNRLGKDKLFSYIKKFGFGQRTGIDLAGEGTGILFDLKRVGPVEQATTAFGQGVSVTPIQQVTAVSAAVNGGTLYTPYVAKQIEDPVSGKVTMRKTPKAKRQVISADTSKKVREALEAVVAKGSGGGAYIESYRVGGKTGTAQKVKDGHYLKNNYIVSFIGFAPVDDPQIVVYIAVDNPKDTTQFGGVVAAPIVGNILKDSLLAMDVKPRKGGLDKKKKWDDPVLVELPNVVGMTREELDTQLLNVKLDVSGKGDKVVKQSPEAGVKVKEGATIRIYLGD